MPIVCLTYDLGLGIIILVHADLGKGTTFICLRNVKFIIVY